MGYRYMQWYGLLLGEFLVFDDDLHSFVSFCRKFWCLVLSDLVFWSCMSLF
jgi:hypothetical protein